MTIRRNNRIETITYSVSGGYMLDIVVEHDKKFRDGSIDTVANAWLYHNDGGLKHHLFGQPLKANGETLKDFIGLVKWHIENVPTHIMSMDLDEELLEEATEKAFEEGRFDRIRELNEQIYG